MCADGGVHSVVFGASPPTNSPRVSTTPGRRLWCPPPVESNRPAWCATTDARRGARVRQHPPRRCVIVQRDQARCELTPDRDLDWHELMATAEPVDAVPVAATDPLYVLYTSGSTGKPKGIVATTAATLWRCCGACATSMTSGQATCSGPLRTWAGWSATLTSSTRRSDRRDHRALRGQAGRHP